MTLGHLLTSPVPVKHILILKIGVCLSREQGWPVFPAISNQALLLLPLALLLAV